MLELLGPRQPDILRKCDARMLAFEMCAVCVHSKCIHVSYNNRCIFLMLLKCDDAARRTHGDATARRQRKLGGNNTVASSPFRQ